MMNKTKLDDVDEIPVFITREKYVLIKNDKPTNIPVTIHTILKIDGVDHAVLSYRENDLNEVLIKPITLLVNSNYYAYVIFIKNALSDDQEIVYIDSKYILKHKKFQINRIYTCNQKSDLKLRVLCKYMNPLDGKFYIVLDDNTSYEILSDDQGIEYIELVYSNDRIFAYNELNE